VILTALNFLAVVLFVPETRYQRDAISCRNEGAGVTASSSEEKIAHVDMKPKRQSSDEDAPQLPKKTYRQELALWSGIPPTNLFKMFIRYV
jgi:hypothetical protein